MALFFTEKTDQTMTRASSFCMGNKNRWLGFGAFLGLLTGGILLGRAMGERREHSWGDKEGVFVSLEAGEARFFLQTRQKAGPCRVRGQGGKFFVGELCTLGIRGWKEYRGEVPKGWFRILGGGGGTAAFRIRAKQLPPAEGWSYREGLRIPRFHLEGGGEALRWRGDLYRWGKSRFELCLEITARKKNWGAGETQTLAPLRIPLPRGSEVSFLRPPSELGWKREGSSLLLDPGPAQLREGDRTWVLIGLGMAGSSPSRKILPSEMRDQLRSTRLGLGKNSFLRFGRAALDLQAFPFLVGKLLMAAPPAPEDRGDFPRVFPDGGRVWTHGEFDLPFALWEAALLLRRKDVLRLAHLSARHIFGRDLGDGAGGRSLLPAQHSGRHGGDRIQPGHVFLQGALGLALSSGDRSFLGFLHLVAKELKGWVLSPEWNPKALRDLAWPLLAFEMAQRVWKAEGCFGKSSEAVLHALDRAWDDVRGGFSFPESRNEEEQKAFRPLWIEGGLLVPALALAKLRGHPLARRLLRRIKKDFHRLGLRRDPFIRAQASGNGPWRKVGGRLSVTQDPLAQAWVLEGIQRLGMGGGKALTHHAHECLSNILRSFRGSPKARKASGPFWDPATRLAIALQASWIRASLEKGLSGSPDPRPKSPFRFGR